MLRDMDRQPDISPESKLTLRQRLADVAGKVSPRIRNLFLAGALTTTLNSTVDGNLTVDASKAFSNKGASATRTGESPKSPFVASVAEAAPLTEPQNAPEADGGVVVGERMFYNQARGNNLETTGYFIDDRGGVRFLSEFRRFGGIDAVGYPASQRFEWDGFTVQVFQRVVFQWRPEVGQAYFVNVFDWLSQKGFDDRLNKEFQVPYQKKEWNEQGMPWEQIKDSRLKVMDAYPAVKAKFFSAVGDPIQANGLPTSEVTDMGNHFALRAQRVVFQQWKEDVPWAKKGEVTVALGGDMCKKLGVIPTSATLVENINGGTVPEPIIIPEPVVNLPELPGGGISQRPDPDYWRNHYLSGFTQDYKESSLSVQGFGRLDSWTVIGDRIILNINISGSNRQIALNPKPNNTVRFFAGRTTEIFFYASPDIIYTKAALGKYFKPGDPIAFFVRTDGATTKDGSGQRVTTWE